MNLSFYLIFFDFYIRNILSNVKACFESNLFMMAEVSCNASAMNKMM